MSTMALSSRAAVKSTLNPNAPLFIPMAFQQVEDFSPEWWELVKTTSWFREHWFHRHQDQENFDADEEEDIANLLPDSIDLGLSDELSILDTQLANAAFHHSVETGDPISMALKKGTINYGFVNDAEAVVRSLGLKSPKSGVRPTLEPAKYREKPMQRQSPKCSPRHFIRQPR